MPFNPEAAFGTKKQAETPNFTLDLKPFWKAEKSACFGKNDIKQT